MSSAPPLPRRRGPLPPPIDPALLRLTLGLPPSAQVEAQALRAQRRREARKEADRG